jgi:hypothetical protein
MTVLQFKRRYQPSPRNGTVFVMEVPVAVAIDLVTGDPTTTVTRFDITHESASGDSFGTLSTHDTRPEAAAAAQQEAIRLNAIYEPGPGETKVDARPVAACSTHADGGAA